MATQFPTNPAVNDVATVGGTTYKCTQAKAGQIPAVWEPITGVSDGIGYGQTWQNVEAARPINTAFTNSTGKPIFVAVAVLLDVAGAAAQLVVDGQVAGFFSAAGPGTYCSMSTVVPPGSVYSMNNAGGSPSISYWRELR